MVLCVDEKSQIQALDRTQPGLPLKKGRAATMTHDYKRHGTTTLFAALDVKSGKVIGDCMPRHPLPLSWFACKPREGRQGVPEISAAGRQARARASSRASGARQLRHPQDARGDSMAGQAPTLQAALHAHQRLMAEPSRTLLRRNHIEAHPAQQLFMRR